jgi:hypothetical protein
MSGLLEGYSGAILFAILLWVGHNDKKACFFMCVAIAVGLLVGVL